MSALSVLHPRCEYLVDPLGIDERSPRLSWQIESSRRGARQVAFRVLVASDAEKLGRQETDRWDSGRVESDQTAHVVYEGAPLVSRDRCFWCVEVWDEAGTPARSAPALWTMGLLEKSDWSARWTAVDPEVLRRDPGAIEPTLTEPGTPPLFRREFDVSSVFRRATLHASARGLFELRLNGRRVGDDMFAPEWTDYHTRIHYRTYDVTDLMERGPNCLAATLGDGWWSGFVGWQETRARYGSLENSLLVQLEVELADGRRLTVGTDGTWQCNSGPILSSDFMMGEVYDARRERAGWDQPGLDDPSWLAAREVDPPATALLVAQRSEPVRITETIPAKPLGEIDPGVALHDLGQNITGWVRLELAGVPAGTRLTLRHGERLTPDGRLYTENLRRAKATDVYISRGEGAVVWQPHFTFHGFQYIELRAEPPLPPSTRATLTRCVVHSALPPAGHFECSHAGVNRLWLNGVWSQRDNFLSVPTDCPQRDERLGWMGDAQVFLRTATCHMDVAAFFTKWMVDVEDAQTPDGVFPDVAPRVDENERFVGLDDLCGGAGWADAGVIVPYTLWRVYGDRRIVERHWRAMTAWMDYLERTNREGLRTRDLRNNYGDWLCIPTDTSFRTLSPMKNLLATAYWADDAAKMACMARALGQTGEADRFQAMFEKVRVAFQGEFLREDGRLAVETQTAYLLALAFDLLPAGVRARATEHLVEDIRSLDWHLSTGFIGISHLNPQLTLNGRTDVAYRLLLQETYPGWLYPIKHGATTIWERWNGWTKDEGFFNPHMNSFNHYSLGSVGEWLFRHVAGIELDPEVPGFKRLVLKPHVADGLDFARATYRTMHGEIESHWQREASRFTWTVCIPANTSARVFIPCDPGADVKTDGLQALDHDGPYAICEAPAGRYRFESKFTST